MIINLDRIPCGFRHGHDNTIQLKFNVPSNKSAINYYLCELEKTKSIENLFLINPSHIDFFKHIPLSEYMPAEIVDKVRMGNVLLTINLAFGAYYSAVETIYEHLVIKENIDPRSILLIMGSSDIKEHIIHVSDKLNLQPIRFECFYLLERFVNRSILIDRELDDGFNETIIPNFNHPLLSKSHQKKYINMTRLVREHKLGLLLLLKDYDLIKDGYISFPGDTQDFDDIFLNVLNEYDDSLHPRLKNGYSIINDIPLIIDTNDFHKFNLGRFARSLLPKYNSSYFSLVNETHYSKNHPYFPTEKIFKAIFHKHPFILNSTSGFLKGLKSQGYKTFSPYIDESYDDEKDDGIRLLKIVDEVKRLCDLSITDLQKFKEDCLEITNHNFNVLMTKKIFLERLL